MIERRKKIILVVSLFITGLIYFSSSYYIVCSNDGSHYALVASVAENQSLSIDEFVKYTAFIDCAEKDGRYYSDRPVGTALLALPFYMVSKLLEKTGIQHFENHRRLGEVFVVFLANFSILLGLMALFNIFFYFTGSFYSSLISMLVLAFGSLVWLEATHLFSHASSMATLMWAVYYSLKIQKIDRKNSGTVYLIVALLSLSSIIEIQNILFFPAFIVYFITTKKMGFEILSRNRNVLAVSIVIFCCIYSLLIVYHLAAFGELMIKSNKYNIIFREELTFLSSLSGNFLSGLDSLLFNFSKPSLWINLAAVKNKTPGIFVVTPVFLLAIPGMFSLYAKHKKEFFFFFLLVLPNILVAAFHVTTLTRHIFTIIPLVFVPFIFFLEKAAANYKNESFGWLRRKGPAHLINLLLCISILRVFITIHGQWSRNLFEFFPFLREMPSFIIMWTLVFLFAGAWYLLRREMA